jgi:uncharacterized protein YbaA (DUF1428 family)
MSYIDGFVAAVPQANKQAYLDHVREALTLFKDHGAARMVENWADDVPEGKVTDFHRSVRKKDDEAVLFSWIEWPSREARDSGMKAMMQDERMKTLGMPFDGQRLIFGGLADRRDRISQGHRLCGWVRRARPRRQSRCIYQDGAERVACLQRVWRAARRRSLGR